MTEQPQHVDPRVAHHIDALTLLGLLPHIDQIDLSEIRRDFAMYLSAQRARRPFTTWQDAWNAWTEAAPNNPGVITYTPARCKECHGRGFTHRNVSRNLTRTGHPAMCGECRGTRRGQPTRQAARYAPPPQEQP